MKICISKVEPFHVHLKHLPLLTSPLLPQTKTQKLKNESFLIADRSAYHVSKMEIEFPSVPPQEIVVSYR